MPILHHLPHLVVSLQGKFALILIALRWAWEPMACLKQNSPITNYLVEYGRTNTTELRTAITSDTYIFSLTFNANKGLGFLHFGEEYWFRVTARNTNGQGPFSVTLRATPLALPSGMYMLVDQV